MPWLYGPIAAGAPAVETARRVMTLPPSWRWPTMVVALTNGSDGAGRHERAVADGRLGRPRRRRVASASEG